MSRIIKFRAWDKERNKMLNSVGLYEDGISFIHYGNIYDEAFLQTSAYQYALREMGIGCDGMFILALSETGKYTYREADDRMVSFLAALYLWYGKNKSLCQRLNYNVPNVEKLFTNTLQTTESSVQENALPLIG